MATEGAKKALHNYFTRESNKSLKPRRRNQRPEKQVETDCLAWMRARGWDVAIYEAKAVYDPKAGRYVSGRMRAGTVDCQGIMPDGTFVAIEFKAPGRISSFNQPKSHRQKEYLIQKIGYNAFGAVVDSRLKLQTIYEHWKKEPDLDARKAFLIRCLP